MSRRKQALVKHTTFARLAKVVPVHLDLFHGAFDFAATFDFNFAISHVARDLAGVAHDEHAFAGDGLVQLTFDINEVSFSRARDHTRGADQHIFGNQVTFHRARNNGLVGRADGPFEHHAGANENAFVFGTFTHELVFLKDEYLRVYIDIVKFFN